MFRKEYMLRVVVVITAVLFTVTFTGNCKKADISDFEQVIAKLPQGQLDLGQGQSTGEVEIVLTGSGIGNIILDSIEIKGDNSTVPSLRPASVQNLGDRILLTFSGDQLESLLLDPEEGSTHAIVISFNVSTSEDRIEISITVTITYEGETGFQLEIDPSEWSMNYDKSNGTVEVFISGEDIDKIDLDNIRLAGDNTEAEALVADSVSINNEKIHARFPKNLLLDLLLDPEEGSTHTVTVTITNTETQEEIVLTAEITIEDDEDDGGIDPEELELEIDPDEWSMNYDKSNGTVEAFIEGEGIENIDLASIVMVGDNPDAEPLAASSVDINKDKIHAKFPKNQLLDLLDNPEEGSTHTITIRFIDSETGEEVELTAVISIEDDDDDDGEEPEPSDLTLEIVPSQWNLKYAGASGHVTAFIRGDGLEGIDLDSIIMVGENGADLDELENDSAKLSGNHIKADFPKNQVLDLLNSPEKGSTHTITVVFKDESGKEYELTAEIGIN